MGLSSTLASSRVTVGEGVVLLPLGADGELELRPAELLPFGDSAEEVPEGMFGKSQPR